MRDVPDNRLLRALLAASDPTRLKMLQHAADRGVLRTSDARRIQAGSPRSGTASYHLSELTAAGLLVRAERGSYVPSNAGSMIPRLGEALASRNGAEPRQEIDVGDESAEMTILISSTHEMLRELLPSSGELAAEVRRTMADGAVHKSRFRLSRVE